MRALGPVEFAVDGIPVIPGGPRESAVAATLALVGSGRAVSAGLLAEAVWGDDLPPTSRKTLQAYVSRLRARGLPITTDRTGYRLADPSTLDVDAHRFESALEAARAASLDGRHLAARTALEEGLALWRGDALAGVADFPGLAPIAAGLEERRITALEDRGDEELALGDPNVVSRVVELVGRHPHRERLWGQLMLGLYRAGRQADALEAFQRCRQLLVQDLGIEPGHALRDLERRLLIQDPALDPERVSRPGRSGVLTVLMSDIESSTPRWERDPAAMGADLATHDALLGEVIDRHGGSVWKSTGDGLYATFPVPAASVAAAVEAQQALAKQRWAGAGGGLLVRIAIVTGVAEPRDGDWFGPAVNRAARLLEAANGGQVLLAASTVELVGSELPAGVELRYLGAHRFRGLPEERVHDLAVPGVPMPPSRLRTGGPRLRIAPPRTSFVGRGPDLDGIATKLESTRLLTLTGIGGTGKTRLAIEVARRLVDAFADGVYFAELSSITDPAALGAVLAAAVEAPAATEVTSTPTSPMDAVVAHLESREALLLLDNCEHLLNEVEDVVGMILDGCPRITVLATSREAIGAAGEAVWQVRSLEASGSSTSEAAMLFLERAEAADASFRREQADRDTIDRLCDRLDGLPLAIELAAAMVPTMTPSELLSRIDDRFSILHGGRRRVARQQTLQATLDWSWDLLDEEAREVLRRLSVAPGTWSLDAVEGVCGASPAIVDRLVRSSLLTAERFGDEVRYRLLETVRLYAESQLVAGGVADAARARHRDWWLARCEAVPLEQSLCDDRVGQRLVRDLAHVRAALEQSLGEGRRDLVARQVAAAAGAWLHGPRTEAATWLVRALDGGDDLHARARAIVLVQFLDLSSPELSEPDRLLAEAMTALDPIDGMWAVAAALRSVWWSIYSGFSGAPEDIDRYDRHLAAALDGAARQTPGWRTITLFLLGWCQLSDLGRQRRAVELLEQSAAHLPPRSAALASQVFGALSIGYHLLGRFQEAVTAFERSLAAKPDATDSEVDDMLLRAMALVRATDGRPTEAHAVVLRLLEREQWMDRPSYAGDVLLLTAALAVIAGDHERGALLLAGATQLGPVFGSPVTYGLYRRYRPIAQAGLGDRARAVRDRGRSMSREELVELAKRPLGTVP